MMFESVKIVLFCIVAACAYGIAHDMVTVHVCVEYFTVAHPPVFPTASPLLLALGWGIIATWWVGLLLGVPLAAVCRIGRRPVLPSRSIIRPVLLLLVALYAASMLAGCIGYKRWPYKTGQGNKL